ncbi:hypothetical protein niasHT_015609 [Heterodera trifolii]|uniref:Uncharacterized protein n=1 Tax=Heterodera trifolii TaxID=157864 RepID=A0ABD2LCN6_9BILA
MSSSTTSINISDIPQQMRPIAHFVKIANEYATRDVVIQYWCLLKALEDGMKLSGNEPNTKKFLLDLMTILENMKQSHKENDAIMQEIVGQSHIEDQAQRLFQFAYGLDQQSQFGQKLIKAFYTAGYLFDVLTCFGQLDDNIQSARKYAKWRAIDVHNCLKNGEQPKPAANPTAQQQKELSDQEDIAAQINDKLSAELNDLNASLTKSPQSHSVPQQQFFNPMLTHPSQQRQIPLNYDQSNAINGGHSTGHFAGGGLPVGPPTHPSQPNRLPIAGIQEPFRGVPMASVPSESAHGYTTQQGAHISVAQHYSPKSPTGRQMVHKDVIAHHPERELTLEDYLEAKKLAKYAQSAMDYEDPNTAIDYLQKAIAILQKKQQQ